MNLIPKETTHMHESDNIEEIVEPIDPRSERRMRDDNTELLLTGYAALLMDQLEFVRRGPGLGTRHEARLLSARARSRGLKQLSRSMPTDIDTVVLWVLWYRETPGDLIEREWFDDDDERAA
jgi:hypothetical protein